MTQQFPKSLGLALLKAQGELRGVGKDGQNPHYKSKYATLENVTDTIRPVLQSCGIVFMQCPGGVDEHGVMALETILIHAESGETHSSTIGVPLVKRDPQGVGSAITYACRYSLMALLGLPPVDDDGESAGRAETNTVKVLPKAQAGDVYKKLETGIRENQSEASLKAWYAKHKAEIASLPTDWQDNLRVEYSDHLSTLEA